MELTGAADSGAVNSGGAWQRQRPVERLVRPAAEMDMLLNREAAPTFEKDRRVEDEAWRFLVKGETGNSLNVERVN